MKRLQERNFATQLDMDDNVSSWQLTSTAEDALQIGQRLQPPSPFLAVCSSTPSVEVLMGSTDWQLLCYLEQGGWQWERSPSSKKAKNNVPPIMLPMPMATEHVQKHWYTSGVTIQRFYLISILANAELHSNGLKQIAHFQSIDYYEDLIANKQDGTQLEVLHDATPAKRARKLEPDTMQSGDAVPQDVAADHAPLMVEDCEGDKLVPCSKLSPTLIHPLAHSIIQSVSQPIIKSLSHSARFRRPPKTLSFSHTFSHYESYTQCLHSVSQSVTE